VDDFQADIRRAVLTTLAGDQSSPALARLARDVLGGTTDLRRALGEASGQDFEGALYGRMEQAGEAMRNADPAELAALKQAVTDAYENKSSAPESTPQSPSRPPSRLLDDDGDFSDETYRRR